MKLLMVVTDGFEDMEAIGTLSLLRRAGVDVTFASLYASEAKGRYGVSLKDMPPLHSLNYQDYDGLIIPGGPEYQIEEKDPAFLAMVSHFASGNKLIAAICAGPTILGKLGLLKGKKYTCFTSMNEDFGGTYIDANAVVDGNIITGRSVAATLDFSYLIVEKVLGREALKRLKASIYAL